jgi:hypothetical protein
VKIIGRPTAEDLAAFQHEGKPDYSEAATSLEAVLPAHTPPDVLSKKRSFNGQRADFLTICCFNLSPT